MKVKSLTYTNGGRDIEVVSECKNETDLAMEMLNSFLSHSMISLDFIGEDVKEVIDGKFESRSIFGGGGFVEIEVKKDNCILKMEDKVNGIRYEEYLPTNDVYLIFVELSNLEKEYFKNKPY